MNDPRAKEETSRWAGWKHGELQVHFIHTGVAESIFYILPDGTTMLCDCGDHPAMTRLEYAVPVVPGPERLAGDWIARYVRRVLPEGTPQLDGRPLIDFMMLSHFHDDHCGTAAWQSRKREPKGLPDCYRSGFALAAETLSFRFAVDRGFPDYTGPHDFPWRQAELDHMKRLYAALKERDGLQVSRFELGSSEQLRPLHDPASVRDFRIANIAANGCILRRDGTIRDLYEDNTDPYGVFNENGMSLGMLVRYGRFSLYAAGDFSDWILLPDGVRESTEEMFAAELPSVDVAKINHHGYMSMPEKLVRALSARVWTACVWDQLHVMDDVLDRLANRNIYPGPRTLYPTVFPEERCRNAAGRPFMVDLAQEVRGKGAHVVVTVPPGGERYTVTCIDASDEEMRILGKHEYLSHGI